MKILTWHVHGSYLYYLLAKSPHEWYLPVNADRTEGYGGLPAGGFPWPGNAFEIPADDVRNADFDCVLFQSQRNYLLDQFVILSKLQRSLPRIYLEHDPPREHPTDTKHIVDDPNMLLVHVTHFNELMWDNNRTPTYVIEHGVTVPEGVRYTGENERGIVIVNGLAQRGRRLGADVFQRVRQEVPLDLVGMQSDQLSGVGEISHDALPAFEARYRFFFNPIRYTSLGLAVCEAMMIGMPVIGLATTEMATTIVNGMSGYVDTNIDRLIDCMRELLADPVEAQRLGNGARNQALEKFHIDRFTRDWNEAFTLVTGNGLSRVGQYLGTRSSERVFLDDGHARRA